MPDEQDGIQLMRARMNRGQRTPPPPRRATPTAAPVRVSGDPPPPATAAPAPPAPAPEEAPATPRNRPAKRRDVVLTADDPLVNLAIRVRRPLDEHLVELLHRLRKDGVRSSKVELVELLLWELPADEAALRRRLAEFRRAAPMRGMGT